MRFICALLLSAGFVSLACGDSIVKTKADILFEGKVTRSSSGFEISGNYTDVLLTKETKPVPVEGDQVGQAVYLFHQNLVKNLPKGREKVGLVTTNLKQRRTSADGITDVTLTDPVLGDLSFRMAITKVTPQSVHWTGLEYEHEMSFDMKFSSRQGFRLVDANLSEDSKSKGKAALFYAQAKQFDRATEILKTIPPGSEVDLVQQVLNATQHKKYTEDAVTLALKGRLTEASEMISDLEPKESWPDSLSQLLSQLAGVKKGEDWLDQKGWDRLSDRSCWRLNRYLENGLEKTVSKSNVEKLTHQWAENLPTLCAKSEVPSQVLIHEAVELANAMGRFVSGDGSDLVDLTERFSRSKLSLRLKIDIAKYAPPAKAVENTKWHRVDFTDPSSKGEFHYYLSFPPNYDKSTPLPLLVTLHGMTTKADVMRRFWGATADRHGYVIVSPEYIYGRPSGFRYSNEEIRALVGAVEHASRTLPIDSSRVLLQGHSQGGHTAWEVGCVAAHRFSGVIPLLGITRRDEELAGYGATPLYLIDGSLDGTAPFMIRDSMVHLNRLGVDATYVEYRNRRHEAFYEEYPRVMKWARAYQRKISTEFRYTAFRPSDVGGDWLEILETEDPLPLLAYQSPTKAHLKAKLTGNRLVIQAKNVKRLAVHIPFAWIQLKELEIRVGRTQSKATIKPSWRTLLERLYKTGDRENLTAETRVINY